MVSLQTTRKSFRDVPSLLAADSEEEPSSEEESDLEDNRPSLLPLDEVIRAVPSSLSSLLEVIVPRLQQRSGVKGLSPDDQQSFVSILVGELSSQFSDLKQQIDDPFLSPQKNRTLHRLVAVQVCRILEELYGQYVAKAIRLSDDGVLSIAAHMSRLRAQLAIQASKSSKLSSQNINLPAIRRQVLSQLRGPLPTSRSSRLPRVPRWQPPRRAREKTDLNTLDLGAPLSSKLSQLVPTGSGLLRRRRVQKLRACMTQHGPPSKHATGATQAESDSEADVMDEEDQCVTLDTSPEQLKLQRAPSMPELFGNFLLCDWKLLSRNPYHIASPTDHRREKRHQALRTGRRASIGSNIAHDHLKWTSEEIKVDKSLGDYTQEDFSSDLHQLSEVEPSFIHSLPQNDIDPLLQACGYGLSRKQRSRLEAHDQMVRMRQEEVERRREEEERQQRERQALPTLEDMQKMQYLREQAPQSLSHSHASLHMRSDASDCQTHSQAPTSQLQYTSTVNLDVSACDIHIEVDHWSDVEAKASSQASVSHASLSLPDTGGSGMDLSQSLASGSLQQSSGRIPDPVPQHASMSRLIPDPVTSTSGLIPDPVSRHAFTSGLIPDPVSRHASTSGLIPDPVSQHSSLSNLGSVSHIPDPAIQRVRDSSITLDPHLQRLQSNSLTSRLNSNTLMVERSRPQLGSSRHLLARESGLLGDVSGHGVSVGSQRTTSRVGGGSEGQATGGMCGSADEVGGVGMSLSDLKSFSMTTFSDAGSHGEGEVTSDREPEKQGPQPQPAVITTRINDKVIRSSDVCVSERKLLTTLRLKPYKPIWNELTGELDRKTVDELDSNLTEDQEMDILYHELMKTIPKDYLDMESDPSLIPAIQEAVDLSSVLASSSLPHRPSRRVVNPDLRPVSEAPPWGDKSKRDKWKKSNLYTGPDPKELMAPKGSTLTPAQARLRQQYQNWLKWWKSTVTPEDYLKFVAQKETDYLHHVYHLYDSEGSESEAEEEKDRRERLLRLHSKLQAKQARCAERYHRKNQYKRGMWNVNTVLMGGLGEDPDSSGSSSEEDIEDQLRQLQQNGKEPEEGMQQRLQAVWSRLQLSHQQSIEMAVKYSSHQYRQQTKKAITLWEKVCEMIEEREEMLVQLLTFEKSASDPSRLFAKGGDTTRLQEAKTRRQVHSALDNLDRKLSQTLRKLQTRFGDVVTYKGRPYHEKMSRDRTELLYLLQQDRRTDFLTHHSKPTHVNISLIMPGRVL